MAKTLFALLTSACWLAGVAAPPSAAPPPAPAYVATPAPSATPTPDGADPFPSPRRDGKLEAYLDAASRGLDPRQRAALDKISGTARRLLALRGYLRRGAPGRTWSWTEEEVASYKKTAEYRAALAEVEKVKATFASLNPGHTLHVNTEVRSLDEQVRSWNRVESVRAAAEELLADSRRELSAAAYKEPPDGAGVARFGGFLKARGVSRPVTVAVPGFSPHGQMRAFDFQVKRGGAIIADTSTATIASRWDGPGWTVKLKAAVAKSGARMTGPLQSPREPWHYTYKP